MYETVTCQFFIEYIKKVITDIPMSINDFDKLQEKIRSIRMLGGDDYYHPIYAKAIQDINSHNADSASYVSHIYKVCSMILI